MHEKENAPTLQGLIKVVIVDERSLKGKRVHGERFSDLHVVYDRSVDSDPDPTIPTSPRT